jgi:HK97 family phage portal protein
MRIETLASLALDSGCDILAVRNEMRSSDGHRGSELYELLTGGVESLAGTVVTERSAMTVSTVVACVNLIAGAIASLPKQIFDGQPGADIPMRIEHSYYRLLNVRPSEILSAAIYWQWLLEDLLLGGDAFSLIQRNGYGDVVELLPLRQEDVQVHRVSGQVVYDIWLDEKPIRRLPAGVLHVPGAGFDGLRGLPVVRHSARTSIGLAMAADEYSARFFKHGGVPDVFLKTDGDMDDELLDKTRRMWAQRYGSLERSRLPAVLQGGLDVKTLGLKPEDAQLNATRGYQVEDVCRFYGVPPWMVGHTEKTTSWGAGIETMGAGFSRYTLSRYTRRIEEEFSYKLFPDFSAYMRCNLDGLERADIKSRYEAHRMALGGSTGPGFATPNEVRALEGRPPIDGGDTLIKWEKTSEAKPTA